METSERREIEHDLIVGTVLALGVDGDVLLGAGDLDRLVDQLQSLLPGGVLDVVAAQGQDAVLGDFTLLVHLERLRDDGLEVGVGVARPLLEALVESQSIKRWKQYLREID